MSAPTVDDDLKNILIMLMRMSKNNEAYMEAVEKRFRTLETVVRNHHECIKVLKEDFDGLNESVDARFKILAEGADVRFEDLRDMIRNVAELAVPDLMEELRSMNRTKLRLVTKDDDADDERNS
jgi:hypothetical protein